LLPSKTPLLIEICNFFAIKRDGLLTIGNKCDDIGNRIDDKSLRAAAPPPRRSTTPLSHPKGKAFRVSASILPHPRLSSQVAAMPQPGRPKNERRMKMKTTKTKSTSVRDELLREVEASLQAGRIDAGQAEMMRQIIRDNDSNCNLDTLRYFERLHALHKYIEFHGLGFTIHEFTYHYRFLIPKKEN
jgi:hypothetical protein